MRVKYSHCEGTFEFTEKDYVTIIIGYLYVENIEDELFYHGTITKVEEEGFWCLLDDTETQEEYFSFLDIEDVIVGDRIPFFNGTTARLPSDYPSRKVTENLSDFSWKILRLLDENKQLNFNELRQRVYLTRENFHKEVNYLEGALLIKVQHNSDDQQSILYSLTEYGKVIVDLI